MSLGAPSPRETSEAKFSGAKPHWSSSHVVRLLRMRRNKQDKPVGVLFEELRDLVTEYVRQETIEPAKLLGRGLVFSLAGGFVLSGGFLLLLLGLLRLFQTEVWVFPEPNTGWSWLPYVMTGVVGIVIVGLAVKLTRGGSNDYG